MNELYPAAAAGAILTVVVIYVAISYRIALGVTAAERTDLEDSPADYGVDFEEVEFRSRCDDVLLDGWYLAGQDGAPVVVFVHGVGVTRTACGMTRIAADLNSRGFGALMFDLRGHGLSGGKRLSGGWHERLDVLGAYDYLCGRGFAPEKIGMLGLSMGSGAVALAAAEEPGIRAVVLDSPYARASEMVVQETSIKMHIPKWLAAVFRPCAEYLASRVFEIDIPAMAPVESVRDLGYPVLIIHSTDDDRIPLEHGRRVHRAAPEGSVLWEVADSGHNEASTDHPSEYAGRVAEYFASRLRGE